MGAHDAKTGSWEPKIRSRIRELLPSDHDNMSEHSLRCARNTIELYMHACMHILQAWSCKHTRITVFVWQPKAHD